MAELTYFKKFDTKGEYDAYIGGTPVLPNVSIVSGSDVYFTDGDAPEPPHDYSKDYLTFNIISSGTIYWKTNNMAYAKSIEYSKDNGSTWTSITSTSAGAQISVNSGDKVQFRGNGPTSSGYSRYNMFSGSTAVFELEGNIMSLVDSTGYTAITAIEDDYAFQYLFQYCLGLTSAENLILPATTLTRDCYDGMFYGCTRLTTAPELPATVLAQECYIQMFYHCTSLTTAPELPATTLASYCYQSMFGDCTSLTTAPELPATTVVPHCYNTMFANCTSLTTAPELPATTLAYQCYYRMFQGCTSLNYIKCLATDISAGSCTSSWVGGVVATGTFVKNPNMSSWTTGTSGIPQGWTVQDA